MIVDATVYKASSTAGVLALRLLPRRQLTRSVIRGVLTTSAFTSRRSLRVSQRRLSVDSDSVTLDSDPVLLRPDLDSESPRLLPALDSESVLVRPDLDSESLRFRPVLDSESVRFLGEPDSDPVRFLPGALSESRRVRFTPAGDGSIESAPGSRAPAQITTLAIQTRFFTH